mmetsp:Transcript_22164/g.33696  ORF Transcript_22164/g.33696 Transcript_22164/m.33696 type:complete len:347 (-) Transcript_22164:296-1336(-)
MSSERELPTTHRLNGPSELLPLVSSFVDLSAGTEFQSYKESQWRFLLSGEDITGYVIHSHNEGDEKGGSNDDDNDDAGVNPKLDGCVLKVHLDDTTIGFGMVLVRPSTRGRGLAKALLNKAFETDNENEERHVLAVCSALGQPVYRKLGFDDVGTVTMLTCSVSDIMQSPWENLNNEHLATTDGKDCTSEQINTLINHDAAATGIRRKERMDLLLRGYANQSRSTVAFLSSHTNDDDSVSTGVARQDCIGGPLIIGPMRGREEHFIPLLHALIEKHFENDSGSGDVSGMDGSVMMMITGHPNLMAELMEIKGMSKLWECPAMTSDGEPIYQNGDGSYLAMMHPTLG